jgi:hypothetical protein
LGRDIGDFSLAFSLPRMAMYAWTFFHASQLEGRAPSAACFSLRIAHDLPIHACMAYFHEGIAPDFTRCPHQLDGELIRNIDHVQ